VSGNEVVSTRTLQPTDSEDPIAAARAAAIVDHWRLEFAAAPDDLAGAAERQAWDTVLDALLVDLATHPQTLRPHFALAAYGLLRGRRHEARLLLRTLERRLLVEPDWAPAIAFPALAWLLEPADLDRSLAFGEMLLDAPASFRRAFLPHVLRTSATSDRAKTLARAWLARAPEEPEAWWSALAVALARGDQQWIAALVQRTEEPRTTWQWYLAFRIVPALPESSRWSYLENLFALLRRHPLSADTAARIVEELRKTARTTQRPEEVLIASLLATHLSQEPGDVHLLDTLPEPDSPIASSLLARLAVRSLQPRSLSPTVRHALAELVTRLGTHEPSEATAERLLPIPDALTIVEFALQSDEEELVAPALEALERLDVPPQQLRDLARRLHENGFTSRAVAVLRIAARRAHERHDRASLLASLRLLVQLDPTDERALDIVVTADTRGGNHARALETLRQAAERAGEYGDSARRIALLERAASLAELVDDRPQLALIAELLASSDPDNPDRHIYAATAALRAGQSERARAHLWTAIRSALQQRRLQDALTAAEQLVGLAPHDEAARAQLVELRALHDRVRRQGA